MSVVLPRPHTGSGVELFHSAATAPYAAAIEANRVPLLMGAFTVVGTRREPVLLIRLRRSLADEAVAVRLRVDGLEQPLVTFAPFTAEGTLLPGFRPVLPEGSDGIGDLVVDAEVHVVEGRDRLRARPTSLGAPLDNENAFNVIEAVVLEGRFARLLYLATLEKQRCIREARQISAMRHRELAYGDALDRRGLDLGVPRITEEDDDHFRSRLAIYSSWRIATPQGFADALNGPGEEEDPNTGLPALVGVTNRFHIVEDINELSIATKLVTVEEAGQHQREVFHEELRASRLVDLDRPPSNKLPPTRRAFLESVRTTLRDELTRSGGPGSPRFMAPLVAVTLDSAVRLIRALGFTGDLTLKHAYDPLGGSRYELGLGVDLGPLTPHELTTMAKRVEELAGDGTKDDLSLLAADLDPRSPVDDPAGRWLFEPCGFRTVHVLDTGDIHLSPLPTFGQWIDGPAEMPVNTVRAYESRYHASGSSTGLHVRAEESAAATLKLLSQQELGPEPVLLDSTQLRASLNALSGAAAAPPVPEPLSESTAAGIVVSNSKMLATQLLTNFNLDQIVAFSWPESQLSSLGSGIALRDALAERIAVMQRAGFYSALGVWDDAESRLLLLASVSALPGATTRPGEPPAASFYWYETRVPVPLPEEPDPVQFLQRRGGKSTLSSVRGGLSLLVCIGYARRGLADPFEIRIEAANEDTVFNMDQYGYLMNLLEFLHPIGIEINTFDIRRNHVDADGDGTPEFLTSRASRTYHRYQHRRPFGSGRGRSTRGTTP